jgi:hypothetical protein
LADAPLEKGDALGRGHSRAIQDQILDAVIETDEATITLVSPKEEVRAGEARRGLERRAVGWVAHQNCTDGALDGAFDEVGTGGEINDSGLLGGSKWSRITRTAAVAGVDGLLNGRGVISGTVAFGSVVLDIPEDDPVLTIRDGGADAIMLDILVPVSAGRFGIAPFDVLWICDGPHRDDGEAEENQQGSHTCQGTVIRADQNTSPTNDISLHHTIKVFMLYLYHSDSSQSLNIISETGSGRVTPEIDQFTAERGRVCGGEDVEDHKCERHFSSGCTSLRNDDRLIRCWCGF